MARALLSLFLLVGVEVCFVSAGRNANDNQAFLSAQQQEEKDEADAEMPQGEHQAKVELQMGSRTHRFRESEREFLKRVGGLLKNKYKLHHKAQVRNRGSPLCRHLPLLQRENCEKQVDMNLLHDKTWVIQGRSNQEKFTDVSLDHD